MGPAHEQITETVERLARGEFDPAEDWPVCYELVRSEILRRNLPTRDFAPSSQFGASDWTVDDFTELAGEWISFLRGRRAGQLREKCSSAAHVARSLRRSIYHFVLDQAPSTPRRDLWVALKEALREYTTLTTGAPSKVHPQPDQPFPWQQEGVRSARRRRVVTVPELRAALAVVQQLQPVGWTVESLFKYLSAWSGVARTDEHSLDEMDHFDEPSDRRRSGGIDSATLGRDAAQLLRNQLDENELAILRGYIIPNGLDEIGLEDAARSLGMSKSTLHDRAGRLKKKLALVECDELITMDAEAVQAFFTEIRIEAGKTPGDASSK